MIVHNRAGGIGVGMTIGAGAGCVTVAGGGGAGGAGAGASIVVKAPTSLQRLMASVPLNACTFQK